jgi:hypothetical protein
MSSPFEVVGVTTALGFANRPAQRPVCCSQDPWGRNEYLGTWVKFTLLGAAMLNYLGSFDPFS